MKLKDGMLTKVLDTDSHKVNRKLVVVNSEVCIMPHLRTMESDVLHF